MRTGAEILWIGRLIASCGLALLAGCSRQEHAGADASSDSAEAARSLAPVAQPAFEELLPQAGGPPGYAGSGACRECHEAEHSSWHRSYHRTMTQLATPESVQADFDNVTLTNQDTRLVLTRTNDQFWVHMERLGPAAAGETGPAWLDQRLGLVTGSHHMQVFWVPSGQGNAQLGFPFTWLIPERRWVPRKSTFIRPPDAPHLSEVWNFTCSRCHTTGIEPRVDSARRITETRAGELGIACEACHGPGQRHIEMRRANPGVATVDAAVLRTEIVHPLELEPRRAAQICGFCHSMKWIDRSENWRVDGFRFRPGDDLEETTPVIRPSNINSIPGLASYLERHPELLQDFFWPDGMIRVSGRDYNGLIESPCYKGGQFSCLSCHSMHKSEPAAQLARNRTGNGACTQCHDRFAKEEELAAHTHHAPNSTGSECYNCHMPRTTYGVLKAIRSHQISSPSVPVQLATGRPNACNLCHLDQTLAWTAEHLERWFNQAVPPLGPEDRIVPESTRLALSGDAGQRALIAWHFGWAPAREASGDKWIPPVLGQLLDDPYAAVRCIAERSLRNDPALVPDGYDYTVEPGSRPPAASAVWERWRGAIGTAAQAEIKNLARTWLEDPDAMRRQFDEFLARRNDRPMRLRE